MRDYAKHNIEWEEDNLLNIGWFSKWGTMPLNTTLNDTNVKWYKINH
jgi:hypothetical protein